MHYITRRIDTKEVNGVHFNNNYETIDDIDLPTGIEAVKITQSEFDNYKEEKLSISKYKYDNGFQVNAQKI